MHVKSHLKIPFDSLYKNVSSFGSRSRPSSYPLCLASRCELPENVFRMLEE